MAGSSRHPRLDSAKAVWELVGAQHGVVTREQLVDLGFGRHAIDHRIATGRLHPIHRAVYAVGRPTHTRQERWMAAVLCGGSGAVLSHSSAAALFQIGRERPGLIEISLPGVSHRSRSGLVLHRRPSLRCSDVGSYDDIPVTSPVQTLIDLTPRFDRSGLERAINEADKFDLVHTPDLRKALEKRAGEPGVRRLREILDRRTFRLTREELERCFLALAREAGLPVPSTGQIVNGFEVDFYWPDLGFVVETDGLRYHRTPAEQARDRLRDQTHTAAGFVNLRFTHEQVRYEPEHVREMLTSAWRLLPAPAAGRAASAAA